MELVPPWRIQTAPHLMTFRYHSRTLEVEIQRVIFQLCVASITLQVCLIMARIIQHMHCHDAFKLDSRRRLDDVVSDPAPQVQSHCIDGAKHYATFPCSAVALLVRGRNAHLPKS